MLLGLTGEFDIKTGYLLVEAEGVLGKQHRGAFDTYTNTLTHEIERDDVLVTTRCVARAASKPRSPPHPALASLLCLSNQRCAPASHEHGLRRTWCLQHKRG